MNRSPAPIPGAEQFSSRGFAPDDLAAPIPGVPLHTVTDEQVAALDPLTYEVVRHRIWSITDEMADAMKRMSGSLVVTEGNDFDFAVSDERGRSVQIALYNTELAACIDLAIGWTLKNRAQNPGIDDGDMFLTNDPWVGGGMHQNDVSLIQPIFWEGELFCWTSAVAHQIDLGGVSPGSRTPRADSVFWEANPTPPVKMVQGGTIRRDVEESYVRCSRMPALVSLDLRAKLGANLFGRRRLLELVRRYGAATVKAVMRRMLDDAEQRLRTKLRTLPDGSWHSTQYIDSSGEGDRGIYRVELKLTKDRDQLTFDLRGTSPQTGMINATWAGCRGGIISAVLPMLAGDIPWSPGGLLRCIDIVTEPGTIVDAHFPAAIGKAPVGPAMATTMAAVQCLAKLMSTNERVRRNVISVCGATADVALFAGTTTGGAPFMTVLHEHMATGMGARSYADGADLGGMLAIPMGRIPDAEMTEFMAPMLYVWRREETDSGGPGKFRGGLSGSTLVVPHGTVGTMMCGVSGAGKAVAQNAGIAGGYPGNQQRDLIVRGSDVKQQLARGRIPQSLDEIAGEIELMPAEHETTFEGADAYFTHWQGGGGYMDPILRDPARVAADVRELKVSAAAAGEIYGVVLDASTGEPDAGATRIRRDAIRVARRAGAAPRAGTDPAPASGPATALSENFVTVAGGEVRCGHCGSGIATDQAALSDGLVRRDGHAQEAGPQIGADPAHYTDEPVVFRQYLCPGCGTAVTSQIVPAARSDADDVVAVMDGGGSDA